MSNYNFYLERIEACTSYGLFSGDQILDSIRRSAAYDDTLTEDELDNIIFKCNRMHNKLMEENYNEQWK